MIEEQFGNDVIEAHCSDGVILASGRPCRPSRGQRPEPAGTDEPEQAPAEPLAELRTALRA